MATGVSIHFREDVSDKLAAERVLKGHPDRSYISWRVGTTDDSFVVSYNSESFRRTEHVPLKRLPNGSFLPSTSIGSDASQPYETLGEFIATRRYLDVAQAIKTVDTSSSSNSSSTGTPTASGLQRRHVGSNSSATTLGGRADIPADLPLPSPSNSPGESEEDLIIQPTCGHSTQRLLFMACTLVAAVLALWTRHEYSKHECEC